MGAAHCAFWYDRETFIPDTRPCARMKPGDLVEFKEGLFGLKAPANLGIFLERVKRKGSFHVILFTTKGRQEIRPENVTARKLSARVPEDLPEAELATRLRQLIAEFGKGKLVEEVPVSASGELTDRDIWFAVADEPEPLSPEAIAAKHFRVQEPSRGQLKAVKSALESCLRPGVGYFERVAGRAELWRPIARAEHKAITREIEGLRSLRKRLIVAEEVIDETDKWARPKTVYRGIPLADLQLTDDDRARLQFLKRVYASFILHDRDTGEVGLAGTHVTTIDGYSLWNDARWLALDWTGAQGVSNSSVFCEFLVDLGLMTQKEVIELIAARRVLNEMYFDLATPPEIERAAARFEDSIPAETLARREDLRALPSWTIDPADAKDHDDAVSYRRNPDGTHTLWVHIADVAEFVAKDSALDGHARKRGTSVYLPIGVLPMLPSRLSDDLCSLNANVDRLAMTVILEYDASGAVVSERAVESVIRVAENISYGEVDDAIARGDEPYASMEAFARLVGARRRGLSLETNERKIRLTDSEVHAIERQGTAATRMIEVFMVAANEAVARMLTARAVPLPYRCHPIPDRAGVDRFNAQMRTMEMPVAIELPPPESDAGLAAGGAPAVVEDEAPSLLEQLKKGKLELVGGGFRMEREPAPEPESAIEAPDAPPKPAWRGLAQLDEAAREAWLSPFRDALAKVSALDDPEMRELVHLKMLGSLGRAFYTTANLGHFGLGSTCYAHFTSPIRRYPDTVVHRQLKAILRGEAPPHGFDEVESICEHASAQGAAAEALERGLVNASMVFASRTSRWSGTLKGRVSGITKGGVFLTLEGGLEARLPTSDLAGGPWAVDDADSMLFAGSVDRPEIEREVSAKNWRDLWDEEKGEMVRVRLRLGDVIPVVLRGRDYVEGRVAAREASAATEADPAAS